MKLVKALGVVLAFPACFSFGFLWRDIRHGQLTTSNRDRLLGIKSSSGSESEESIFKQSFGRILADYTKRPNKTELKYSAMEGLVSSLGDPHTNFFVPKVNTEFRDETQGKFYGIGARLLPDPLGVKVVSVFKDGPAQRVGVKGSDVIVAVDGKVVAGMQSDDIVLLIKGKEGTSVKLKVSRPGAKAPLEFTIPS
jgi:carboxyl-terminal processing protease